MPAHSSAMGRYLHITPSSAALCLCGGCRLHCCDHALDITGQRHNCSHTRQRTSVHHSLEHTPIYLHCLVCTAQLDRISGREANTSCASSAGWHRTVALGWGSEPPWRTYTHSDGIAGTTAAGEWALNAQIIDTGCQQHQACMQICFGMHPAQAGETGAAPLSAAVWASAGGRMKVQGMLLGGTQLTSMHHMTDNVCHRPICQTPHSLTEVHTSISSRVGSGRLAMTPVRYRACSPGGEPRTAMTNRLCRASAGLMASACPVGMAPAAQQTHQLALSASSGQAAGSINAVCCCTLHSCHRQLVHRCCSGRSVPEMGCTVSALAGSACQAGGNADASMLPLSSSSAASVTLSVA